MARGAGQSLRMYVCCVCYACYVCLCVSVCLLCLLCLFVSVCVRVCVSICPLADFSPPNAVLLATGADLWVRVRAAGAALGCD